LRALWFVPKHKNPAKKRQKKKGGSEVGEKKSKKREFTEGV